MDPGLLQTPLYSAQGDAIVRHNGGRFNNRPLYCSQISAIVLAGDRPLVRLGNGSVLQGTFMAALLRDGKARWLHDFSDITAKYRADRMEWVLKDGGFGATTLTLDAVPAAQGPGMALRLRIDGAQLGDRLIWSFGGAVQQKEGMLGAWDVTTGAWDTSVEGRQKMLARGFVPEDCRDNRVTLDGERCIVQIKEGRATNAAIVTCGSAAKILIADAEAWPDPLTLAASSGAKAPLACAVLNLDGQREIHWAMQSYKSTKTGDAPRLAPAESFAAGLKRAEEIGGRVIVNTPDARLNAMVGVSNAVMDGVYRDGIFTHSGMRWGVPLLGWRSIFGGTAYGWHDRVKAQARTCLARQITESERPFPRPIPSTA